MRYNSHHIIDFSEIDNIDSDLMGKNAYLLGELKYLRIPIPDGFVIMPFLFKKFLEKTGILEDIKKIQKLSHPSIESSMTKLFFPIQDKILHTHLPKDLAFELHEYYRKLSDPFKESTLNIFTSPMKGRVLRFSSVKGDANFLLKIKEIWALQFQTPTSIVVQKNIQSKVKGKFSTNESIENKQNSLNSSQISKLAGFAKKIQKHLYFPQEVEFVIEKNKIYITSVKPLTITMPQPMKPVAQARKINKLLSKGIPLNPGIATGLVRILRNQDYYQVKKDEIAVVPQLNKILLSKIFKAKAIIVDSKLSSEYDKMNYRKNIKVPTVMGVKDAIKIFQNRSVVTVNGINGEIYSGGLIY